MRNNFLFSVVFAFIFLIFPQLPVLSHPGNTDSSGCHTCRTNCPSWGLSYGEYHCHNNKGTTQPLYPIHSTWGDGGTGYTTPAPDYSFPSYTTPNIPSCPIFSSYSYLSETCKCNSGYVTNESRSGCISMNTWCTNKYGWQARYNSLLDQCECGYGYVFEKNMFGDLECVDADDYCEDLYGYNSRYNSLTDKCECDYGYHYDGNVCVKNATNYNSNTNLDSLLNQLSSSACGLNSHIVIGDKCECDAGYIWEDYSDANNFDCKIKSCELGSVLKNNECITYSQDCKNSFGDNVVGVKGDNNNSDCYCAVGFEWNANRTLCVKKTSTVPVFTNLAVDKINKFITEEKEKVSYVDKNLSNKLSGKILLQVENNGEAWYVNPKNNKRHYMANGDEAYNIMRNLGIGITNSDLEKVKNDLSFAKKHSGKIFLQIEDLGQAYYIDFNGKEHYLKNGEAAYSIMRELGLGITNNNLNKIDIQ